MDASAFDDVLFDAAPSEFEIAVIAQRAQLEQADSGRIGRCYELAIAKHLHLQNRIGDGQIDHIHIAPQDVGAALSKLQKPLAWDRPAGKHRQVDIAAGPRRASGLAAKQIHARQSGNLPAQQGCHGGKVGLHGCYMRASSAEGKRRRAPLARPLAAWSETAP